MLVSEDNTAWNTQLGVFMSFFDLKREATADESITTKSGNVGDMLRVWYLEGTAAGNHGDLYDNHDCDHSNMNFKPFPQLTRVEFSEAVRKETRLAPWVAAPFQYNGLRLAILRRPHLGTFWRSQPAGAHQSGGALNCTCST